MTDWPVTVRTYKTPATRRRAEKRLGGRVAWVGGGHHDGKSTYELGVYDLDEFGQAPVLVCECCGQELPE